MAQFGSLLAPTDPTRDLLIRLFRLFGFWGSVLLPVAYFPVLYVTNGSVRLVLLTALVSLNVACLFAGHRYTP